MNDENELLAEQSNYVDSLHDELVDEKRYKRIADDIDTTVQQVVPQLDEEGNTDVSGNAAMAQGFLPDNPLQLLSEAGTALVGGAADAVDSVGSFGDLVGDTLKTGVNKLFGKI